MNIGIDYTPALSNKAGIGFYTEELTRALLRVDKANTYTIYATESVDLPGVVVIPRPAGIASGVRWMRLVSSDAQKRQLDYIISSTSLTFPLFARNVLQIVHDLAPLVYPQAFSLKQRLVYRAGLWLTALRAKRIFFISETVAQEYLAKYQTKVPHASALAGLNSFTNLKLTERQQKAVAAKLELPSKYFCSVSTIEPRKNYAGMIKAFAKFVKNYPDYYYLIAGKPTEHTAQLQTLALELGLTDRVRFLGYVAESEKWVLIHNALGFMYVSHYEGFGFPNIEAYALGTSVLTSDIAVNHEVMIDKAYYANPSDPHDIARKLQLLISTKRVVDQKFLQRFSWSNVARAVASLY